MAMVSPFSAGLRCKCPQCGRGALFDGLLKVAPTCSTCGLDLTKQDSGDGPAVFVIFILGAIVVPLVFLLEFRVEPPIWVHLLVWPVVIVVGAVLMLRPLKALMIALQYKNKASEGGLIDYDR